MGWNEKEQGVADEMILLSIMKKSEESKRKVHYSGGYLNWIIMGVVILCILNGVVKVF